MDKVDLEILQRASASRHLQQVQQSYKLYIDNLPEELNENGIRQIFTHYGNIIGLFWRRGASWAYVTYGTYQEAEYALRDLYDKPPLHLKISFAKEKASDKTQIQELSVPNTRKVNVNHAQEQPASVKQFYMPTKGRGNPLKALDKNLTQAELPVNNYTTEDDLLYPVPSDPYTYNPYENSKAYVHTNALWTRGQVITRDGKRHVSMGRGYTCYEIPEPSPEVEDHINKVYEKRCNGMYEYGQDALHKEIGACQCCKKITKFTCERCHEFYCSRQCQIQDWPEHKINCYSIPALVEAASTAPLNSKPEQPVCASESTLRRPKIIGDKNVKTMQPESYSNNTNHNGYANTEDIKTANLHNIKSKPDSATQFNTVNSSSNQMHNGPHNAYKLGTDKCDTNIHTACKKVTDEQGTWNAENKLLKTKHHDSDETHKSLERLQDIKITGIKTSELHSPRNINKPQTLNFTNITKIEEDIAFHKDTFLSKTTYTNVKIILPLGNGEYWVQKTEDECSLMDLMTELQSVADNAQKVTPSVDKMYAVRYEGIWHRAVVISLSPLIVHYIDYGNDEYTKDNDFRKIGALEIIPKFSRKIRLPKEEINKYTGLKADDNISVKMLSIDSNMVINVDIAGANDEPKISPVVSSELIQNSDRTPKPKTDVQNCSDKVISNINVPNVIKNLLTNVEGMLQIHTKLSNNVFATTIIPTSMLDKFERLLHELPDKAERIKAHSAYSPAVGDFVCGQREDGDWLRGYILTVAPSVKMLVIDEARVVPIFAVIPCPKEFYDICTFGVVCTLLDSIHPINAGEQCAFKVVTPSSISKDEKAEIELYLNSSKIRAILTPWTPLPEQKGIHYAELKSGSEVCLTAYRSANHLFARSLEPAEVEHYQRIMQNVAKHAQTAPFIKEPPAVGQMVIAPFADNNHYRGIVTKVQDEKATICYVDFGNVLTIEFTKLQILPDNLKHLQSCTSKIVLKDIPVDVPMTKAVNDYLIDLVGKEIPLTCTFNGIPSKDGVCLRLANGESINEKIKCLLMPTWKTNDKEDDKTCYMLNDLNVASLGQVGDIVDACLLYSIEDGHEYVISPCDRDLITHICDIMPDSITEYCINSEYYIPREKELCLALYQGGWFRAVCLSPNTTPSTSSVMFLDYGNIETVNHTDIRLMIKDFMTSDALGNICTITNLAPTNSNGEYTPKVQKRITELLVPNEIVKIKIIRCTSPGAYDIELPYVHTTLAAEGFI